VMKSTGGVVGRLIVQTSQELGLGFAGQVRVFGATEDESRRHR
jgi:hypothetical protein